MKRGSRSMSRAELTHDGHVTERTFGTMRAPSSRSLAHGKQRKASRRHSLVLGQQFEPSAPAQTTTSPLSSPKAVDTGKAFSIAAIEELPEAEQEAQQHDSDDSTSSGADLPVVAL